MSEAPFGFDTPGESPGFLLWQTMIMWQRLVKKVLEPHKISHAQFVVMALLLWFQQHGVEPNQASIATWSKLDKMTVSKSLKKLAVMGLIHRQEGASDTREKISLLTSKGKKLIQRLVPKVEQVDAEFFGAAAAKDQQTLMRVLSSLTVQ